MKFWILAFVFIWAIGIGVCDTNDQSIFLMTNESIIGIDLNKSSKETFRHKILRNPPIEDINFRYGNFKAVSSNSKELRAVDVTKIVSFDVSDTDNIEQEVMFNSSTYSNFYTKKEGFSLVRNFITGMTVDPITSTTYFTTSKLISAMNSERKWRTLIEFDENGEPIDAISDICLISSKSRLYWLSNRKTLYSAFTDGSDIRKLDANLLYDDFKQMVADQNKKLLYLLSKSDRIVVVNTTNMEIKTYEKAIQSIAVDSKNGDVFITEFDTIKQKLFLKKFDPFNGLVESSLSINLQVDPSTHSLFVHRKDENWTECEDCDGICLRKSDNTTICECPQDFIRDQETGKCKIPEKRVFYLSKNNRIISVAWPDNTTRNSINIAGNVIEFEHFAVDYTRNLVYGTTSKKAIWKFSTNGTFFIKTHDYYSRDIISVDTDVTTGNVIVMTQANETVMLDGPGREAYDYMCIIKIYGHYMTKNWEELSRSDRAILLIRQHFFCEPHLEIDEINGKMFFSTKHGLRSANMNGKDIRLVLSGDGIIFSLDKKRRRIFYKKINSDDIECANYDGTNSSVVLSLENIISLKFVNEELYVIDRENKLHRAIHPAYEFIDKEVISLPNLSSNESRIDIIDSSQPINSTECSIENGKCKDFCIISDGKKQCLCDREYWSEKGKCKDHDQFLAYLLLDDITVYNPDKDSFQPVIERYRPDCKPIPLSVTFNKKAEKLYYSDTNGIFEIDYKFGWRDTPCDPVVKIDGVTTGLAINENYQMLYFINDNYKIMKANVTTTKGRTPILIYESENKNDVLGHLQYDKCSKSLYFSNNNPNGASIEVFKLESNESRQIVQNLDAVYGMAIDRELGRIYYSHKKRKQITRCYYNGKYSEDLMDVKNDQSNFGDIAVFNEDLIYLHKNTEFVAVHKNDMTDKRTLMKSSYNMTFLGAIEVSIDECPNDPCHNNQLQCADLCEPIGTEEAVCKCHPPRILDKDGRTCGFPRCSEVCTDRAFCATMNATHIECICQPGYFGESCTKAHAEVNECFNGGVVDHGNNCNCAKGFDGPQCQNGIAKNCDSLECLNGGRCLQYPRLSPSCKCTDNFYGDNCAYHTCPNYCKNEAHCTEGLAHELPTCDCHVNTYGRRCDQIYVKPGYSTSTLVAFWSAVALANVLLIASIAFCCFKYNTQLKIAWYNRNRRASEAIERGHELLPQNENTD